MSLICKKIKMSLRLWVESVADKNTAACMGLQSTRATSVTFLVRGPDDCSQQLPTGTECQQLLTRMQRRTPNTTVHPPKSPASQGLPRRAHVLDQMGSPCCGQWHCSPQTASCQMLMSHRKNCPHQLYVAQGADLLCHLSLTSYPPENMNLLSTQKYASLSLLKPTLRWAWLHWDGSLHPSRHSLLVKPSLCLITQ